MTQIKVWCSTRSHALVMDSVIEAPASPPRRRDQAPKARSVLPREHGAYGQLLLPLAVAHLTARPTLTGWLFTAAAIAAFVGHEPWLVLLERRGARAKRKFGRRARRVLALCCAAGIAAGGTGFALADSIARQGLALPALLAAIVALLVLRDAERTLTGELLVAATLPAWSVPVALAGGVEPARALATWAVWTLGGAAATGAVRAVISQARQPANVLQRSTAPLAVLGIALLLSSLHLLDARAVVALVPMLEVAAVTALLSPHPRHLRNVGWALVTAAVITAALLSL